jgi:hypothetical protein
MKNGGYINHRRYSSGDYSAGSDQNFEMVDKEDDDSSAEFENC